MSRKNRPTTNASDVWKDEKEYCENMRAYLVDNYAFAGEHTDIPDFIKKIKDELDILIYYENDTVKEAKLHENVFERLNEALLLSCLPLNDGIFLKLQRK